LRHPALPGLHRLPALPAPGLRPRGATTYTGGRAGKTLKFARPPGRIKSREGVALVGRPPRTDRRSGPNRRGLTVRADPSTRHLNEVRSMKPKTMILMIVAVGCGLGASIMTSRLLAERKDKEQGEPTVPVLVTKGRITGWTEIKEPEKAFEVKEYPVSLAPK